MVRDEYTDVCKTCGKDVNYFRAVKSNGRTTHRAWHVDDEVLPGFTKIPKSAISSTYRNRLRQVFHTEAIQKPVEVVVSGDESVVSEVTEVAETSEPSTPSSIVYKAPEDEEIEATVNPDLPTLDVTDVKRNKFAAVGAISRALRDHGMPEQSVNTIRSQMISQGSTFGAVIKIASPNMNFVENGRPIMFK